MSDAANALKQALEERIEDLAAQVDDARKSKQMETWLKSMAKFHNYSFFNQLQIQWTRPDASMVAGYQDWIIKHHRQVRKGEHGIPIFAPLIKKEEGKDGSVKRVLCGFRIVTVFDVSQTDGEPLPEIPNWKSLEQDAVLQGKLTAYAEQLGIVVNLAVIEGNTQGFYNRNDNAITISPAAGTKTLAHELAHALLHAKGYTTRQDAELEAESIAFVIASYFDLPAPGSPNYIALWKGTKEAIIERMNTIRDTAHRIIEGVNHVEAY